MSRHVLYNSDRFTLIGGNDHAIGQFYQLYDVEAVTDESEGIILDVDVLSVSNDTNESITPEMGVTIRDCYESGLMFELLTLLIHYMEQCMTIEKAVSKAYKRKGYEE